MLTRCPRERIGTDDPLLMPAGRDQGRIHAMLMCPLIITIRTPDRILTGNENVSLWTDMPVAAGSPVSLRENLSRAPRSQLMGQSRKWRDVPAVLVNHRDSEFKVLCIPIQAGEFCSLPTISRGRIGSTVRHAKSFVRKSRGKRWRASDPCFLVKYSTKSSLRLGFMPWPNAPEQLLEQTCAAVALMLHELLQAFTPFHRRF